MASSQDLKEVLKEGLENGNVLADIKARIRAEVFSALDDDDQFEGKPPLSNENVLIFELIREFLDFNSCKYSSSVMVAERGLSKVPLDRKFLSNDLNIVEDGPSKSVPLLYSLVSSYKEKYFRLKNIDKNFTCDPAQSNILKDGQLSETADYNGPAAVIVKNDQRV